MGNLPFQLGTRLPSWSASEVRYPVTWPACCLSGRLSQLSLQSHRECAVHVTRRDIADDNVAMSFPAIQQLYADLITLSFFSLSPQFAR